MRRLILVSALMIALPTIASAACGDDADAIARQYHVTSALPSAGQKSTSDKLTASGGVIAPPSTGDLASANAPVPGGDRMQTAPAIAPQTADSGNSKTSPDVASAEAASTAQAASLLQAARDAAKNGNESACKQRLADAVKLLSNTPAKE